MIDNENLIKSVNLISESYQQVLSKETLVAGDVYTFFEKQLKANELTTEYIRPDLSYLHQYSLRSLREDLKKWDDNRSGIFLNLLLVGNGICNNEESIYEEKEVFLRLGMTLIFKEPLIVSKNTKKYKKLLDEVDSIQYQIEKGKQRSPEVFETYSIGVCLNSIIHCPKSIDIEITNENVKKVTSVFNKNLNNLFGFKKDYLL